MSEKKQLTFNLGPEVIRSYKRLAYSPWHAIAEFVDNSTQSYFNDQKLLDAAYEKGGSGLEVSIVYERDGDGLLRVVDNAMGMSLEELDRALTVGLPPETTSGRSQFGMGMKTAACWIGNKWTVRTKKLGETSEYVVTVDVEAVASGQSALDFQSTEVKDPEKHYTVIEITDHNRKFQGRTIGKMKDFLRSMYREDLRDGRLKLLWQGEMLEWDDGDDRFLRDISGKPYRKPFSFEVNDKTVSGWVAILDKGSRASAGFSILRAGRVIRGWPDSWRPEEIFGQFQGSNDLINQRVTGEIHLNDFVVSHTKDDILWLGGEEQEVQEKLKEISEDYLVVARTRRKRKDDERGPSDLEVRTAIEEMEQELKSTELVDLISIEKVPPPSVVDEAFKPLREAIVDAEPAFMGTIGEGDSPITVTVYLLSLSPNDPYVTVETAHADRVSVVINTTHPHLGEVEGSQGFLNYLRYSVYDGIAEWQARQRASSLDPDTIKLLKDRLLRLPALIEAHEARGAASWTTGDD